MVLVVNTDWKPTAEERKKMPITAFLQPSTRKYPYKVKVNPDTKRKVSIDSKGVWAISCKMLKDAFTLANMHWATKTASKAKKLIDKYCK